MEPLAVRMETVGPPPPSAPKRLCGPAARFVSVRLLLTSPLKLLASTFIGVVGGTRTVTSPPTDEIWDARECHIEIHLATGGLRLGEPVNAARH
jgi:hypothetical protein